MRSAYKMALLLTSSALISSAAYSKDMIKATAVAGKNIPQLIVKYNNDIQSSAKLLSAAEVKTVTMSKVQTATGVEVAYAQQMGGDFHLVNLPEDASDAQIQAYIKSIEADGGQAELNVMHYPTFRPNDNSYLARQWHYYEPLVGINAEPAWDLASGQGITVAVIDTGRTNNIDLVDNLVAGLDFISNADNARDGNGRDTDEQDEGDGCPNSASSWHGTHVAGTIAAVTNNTIGVAGVARNAKVQHLRVLGCNGGSTADIADAIRWAAGDVLPGHPINETPSKVINLSLGGPGACLVGSATHNAVQVARSLGSVVVVAAGNENQNALNVSPASCEGVITVAANNEAGQKSSFSNFGTAVEVVAPGSNIFSTIDSGFSLPEGSALASYNGTSMAAPHVAGIAALLFEVNPNASPDDILRYLQESTEGRDVPTCAGCQRGIVDATKAVQLAIADNPDQPVPEPQPPEEPGVVVLTNETPVIVSGEFNSEQVFSIEVPENASNLRIALSGGEGDADLYVARDVTPTQQSFLCRPFINGNNEVCSSEAAVAGTYFIMVHGYDAFAGATLVASFETEQEEVVEISEPFGRSRGTSAYFTQEIPEGISRFEIRTTAGSFGDADLYVRFGTQPTRSISDCKSFGDTNEETCVIENPQAGTWHITVNAWETFDGVQVEVKYK